MYVAFQVVTWNSAYMHDYDQGDRSVNCGLQSG